MAPGRIAGHHRKSSVDSTNPVFSEPLRALEVAFREADARKSELYRRGFLPGGPTLIEHGPIRVLISSSPSTDTLSRYAAHLKSYNVKHIVRVCEPTYSADRLRGSGFEVHDWAFSDGDSPSAEVVDKWLALLDQVFNLRHYTTHVGSDASSSDSDSPALLPKLSSGDTVLKETIAVHCMAGLGRAPVLVALALVELGMDPFEAVGWIRALRRGAINSRQMAFLENYKRRPPPSSPKPRKKRPSGIMGSLFSSGIKAAFRPKTPPGQRKSSNGLSGVQALGTGSPYVALMPSR